MNIKKKQVQREFSIGLMSSDCFKFHNAQYYLEKNLDAREKELEREAELEDKAPKVKAKSKMSKVSLSLQFQY